jgi:hypothetical protein
LKLGNDEPTSSQGDSSSITQKTPGVVPQLKPTIQAEKRPEPERKIIKFDTPEKTSEKNKEDAPAQDPMKKPVMAKTDNKPEGTKIIPDKIPGAAADAAREELEQRRNILQNMKDFDFQIKKNQEEITNIYEKVESLSKDLDDLVSLYEIVSEQMNPFVGLSKVTKKRLDALENIIKEVDGVKTRIGDLESNLEKNGVATKGTTDPIKPKPATETNGKPETPLTPKEPLVIPPSRPTALHTTAIETLNESELDDLLNKSLESLLMEQNIDTMINEFFINLK